MISEDDYSAQLRTQTALIVASALGGRELFGGFQARNCVQTGLSEIEQTVYHSEYRPGDREMTKWEYKVRVSFEITRWPAE